MVEAPPGGRCSYPSLTLQFRFVLSIAFACFYAHCYCLPYFFLDVPLGRCLFIDNMSVRSLSFPENILHIFYLGS